MTSQAVFTYDLLSHLRRDPRKAKLVGDTLQRVERITKAISEGKATRTDLAEAQGELIRHCGFNFGLLIPNFFHRYPLEEPLNLLNRPFMFAMTCLGPDSVVTLKAGRQVGKCVTADTTVSARWPGGEGQLTMDQLFAQGQKSSK